MCVAIYKPAGKVLTDDVLKDCHETNSDGSGFACIDSDGKLFIFKTMDYQEFLVKYKEYTERLPDSPFIIHFRIATHGTVNTFNCHPFIINDDLVFVHNGIIRDVPACPDKLKSDTQIFNEMILQQLPTGWEKNDGLVFLIEKFIFGSKLIVLNRSGDVTIFNEKVGTWHDGCWFSNMLWQPIKHSTYYTWGGAFENKKWCWECGKDITNNIYANTQKVNFCCLAHKNEYNDYFLKKETKKEKKAKKLQEKKNELVVIGTPPATCCICKGEATMETSFAGVGIKSFCDITCMNYYKQYTLPREQAKEAFPQTHIYLSSGFLLQKRLTFFQE